MIHNTPPEWTPEKDLQLSTIYPHMRTVLVAATMGISIGAVNVRAEKIGLKKTAAYNAWVRVDSIRERSPWNDALEEIVALMFPCCTTQHLADLLGMTRNAVDFKARRMGLVKDKAHKSALQRERNLQRARDKPESYKGRTAWNKGAQGHKHPNSVRTQFKPGNSNTAAPVGTLRLRKVSGVEGVLVQKTAMPNTWRPMHTLVWEEFHGRPFPAGRVMAFADGCRHNLQPENLIARTRCEFALLNSPLMNGAIPPEVRHIHILRGALTKAVNRARQRMGTQPQPKRKTQ